VLDAAAAVRGDLVLRDASSRNANAIVLEPPGPGYFLKRVGEPGVEASVYRRIADLPELAPYLPRSVRSDAARNILLLEVEDRARDLWAHHLAGGAPDLGAGREVGRALGVLHRTTRLDAARAAPREAPYVLRCHRPRIADLRELGQAAAELVGVLQRHPAIGKGLDELRRDWTAAALIHGDVKWPNVIVVPGDGGSAPIRLVDWEHARDGDPGWDIGSALAAYVSFWLYSIPASAPGFTSVGLAASAGAPIAGLRPGIRACWEGYLEGAGARAEGARSRLRARAVRFAAARLIRTAYEEAETQPRLSRRAALHAQVAANMLADPDGAAERLLGLAADGGPAG
jgi:hypothetical protein